MRGEAAGAARAFLTGLSGVPSRVSESDFRGTCCGGDMLTRVPSAAALESRCRRAGDEESENERETAAIAQIARFLCAVPPFFCDINALNGFFNF